MSGIQYNIALSIFFIPYVLAGTSLPCANSKQTLTWPKRYQATLYLNRLKRPSQYLGLLIFCWGVIMLCTGFVRNFAGLVVIRFLLGLFE